ncbi:MAG: FAD/NAD(P)-binding protein [Pseudomonadota bacterium]
MSAKGGGALNLEGDAPSADFLIVGAGAMGMAFADVIVKETDASVLLVERQDRPGGHWNHAYPFVRLHQPSTFYGVNSRDLGSGRVDQVGGNAGMRELASGAEVCDYFESVLRHDLLPTGRVGFLGQTEHMGGGRLRSRVTGRERQATARVMVDATYMKVKVPATEPPAFEVADGVDCRPPNALADLDRAPSTFVIVGAGKTAYDAIYHLLDRDVDPDAIIWIAPRDSWVFNRARFQPGDVLTGFLPQMAAIAESTSPEDAFARVEATGSLMRVDPNVTPQMFRCATVSEREIEAIRRVKNVVRLGRVTRLEPGRIELDQGSVDVPEDTLFVNCTADGLERLPPRPIFEGDQITLQAIRGCQQVFSAALIAHVAGLDRPEAEKNAICHVDPHPDSAMDYFTLVGSWLGGEMRWAQDAELFQWLTQCRLSAFSHEFAELMLGRGAVPPEQAGAIAQAALEKIQAYAAR